MANYPIKVLVDEKGQEFIPISSTGALLDPTGQNLDTILASKLETNSIIAGSGITLNKNTTNHTVEINCSLPGASVIDNLTTTTAGQGSLDAHQGYILNTTKINISDIVDNVTSTDADKPLSAYQGYLLSNRIPNKISDLTNDSGFITSSYHDDTKVDKDSIARVNNVVSKNKININGYVAQQYSTRISVNNNTVRVTCLGNGQNMYSCIKIENINELLGKTCTFKVTATSSSSNVPMARIYFGTDNAPATEWANFDLYGETSNTQITSTFPANMPSDCDGAYVLLYGNRDGTGFSAGAYVDYTNIQLEISSSATSYAPYLNLEELMPLLPKMLPMTVNEEYVYTSDLSYFVVRIGKIVILNIRTIGFKSVVPHGGKIIYGLPPAKNGVIFYLYGGNTAKGDTMRVFVDENGEVNVHYGSNTYYGNSADAQYGGTIIYETTD